MQTNEERMKRILLRTEELKETERCRIRKRRMIIWSGASIAACLCLLTAIGSAMPAITAKFQEIAVFHTSGTASMLAGSEALSYVMMAVFAFFLGVCVTVLLHVIHRSQIRQKKESEQNE